MISELERLLSNSYGKLNSYSAVLKLKNGMTFGGVNVSNNILRSEIYAEQNAIASAIAHGYKKGDFDSLYIMTSSNDLNDLNNINKTVIKEFLEEDALIYLYNIKREYRVIKVGNLLNNIY